MSNIIYLKLTGERQGLISRGCGTEDSIGNKFQLNHQDEIFITQYSESTSRMQNMTHHPIDFIKMIDKSTPLLLVANSNNEKLQLELSIYKTTTNGTMEKYLVVKINEAYIINRNVRIPHSINSNDMQPEESFSIIYRDITYNHITAGTSGYSICEQNI
ncbi:Hcp family type VI secretion system effector [Providencia rettgeri]|uniref:Hcp family type VI secretion system effector n=1 Tax=Providencia TaxID=586 RepID=UPI001B377E90|nr:Hcp family type VI secretion system effector [Providencia rettgeri]MBQ0372945.1 Hcp family type VI secretion system effector [Providencia rettgeri]